MQHGRAHVGKGPEFPVSQVFHRMRSVNDPGISREKSGNVCPVLIEVRLDRAGREASCHIGSASGKGVDDAVGICSVKSRDHSLLQRPEGSSHGPPRHGLVQLSGFRKADTPRGIHKCVSEKLCQNAGIQILSAACHIILLRMIIQMLPERFNLLVQREVHAKAFKDLLKPSPDLLQDGLKGLPCVRLLPAVQKKIRHLRVLRESFPRC